MPHARLFSLAAVALLAACSDASPTTGLTPVTGILVRADALVAPVGCGTREDQIFKYAAVVTQKVDSREVTIAGGIFDCFADGAFRQLLPGPNGTLSFEVQIYAFSRASYAVANVNGALDAAATDWNKLQAFQATYKTNCSATQQQDVEVLAVCAPLSAARASVRVDTARFATKAGLDLTCGTAYSKVTASFRTGNETGELPEVVCPSPIVLAPAQAPATYELDLKLADVPGASAPVLVHCRASTTVDTATVATCDAI